ncbi:MAG: hypothetical protein AB1500_07945 [Bacillota bacterium]
MMTPETFVRANLERITGLLQIYGQWFGRPYDNIHRAAEVKWENDVLAIRFSDGEELQVWNPSPPLIRGRDFLIEKAVRVRWSWNLYGLERTPDNRRYYDYVVEKESVRVSTDYDYHQSTQADKSQPAVVLHG